MTEHRPPSRLESSSEDAVLRRALGAARAELPDAERMQRLSAAFAAKLAAAEVATTAAATATEASSGASAGTTTSAATGSAVVKGAGIIKGAGIVVALAVAGAGWQLSRAPEPSEPLTRIGAPASLATLQVSRQAKPQIPTLTVDELPALAPSAPVTPVTPGAPVERESEMELFRQAQQALRSNPALALSLCARHERAYPRSAFAQEREVLTIDALLRSGQRAQAEARAVSFRAAYPRSGHVRRIDAMLGR